ncbi:non-specific lipid transfer protein GPI-anchored 11 isoform X1 [Gossypium hirsutum]|uniref:Non-specific lipid transfer protein GPI-anchored 11 isoform X1 n=1 Tax=Gossypium hirsutum TaxID=3635 RepID=A0ABM3A617_GOSHI|nr:non-specific lipid transfer protein GPI-anchored 11-like isoform X1 [Gossypium hirsutum]
MKSIIASFILMFCITVTKAEMSPSLSPSVSCSTIIYDMIDCVLFLSGDSTEDKPTTACCSGFKIVLETNVKCFCEALKSSAELGADVNLTKAVMLPSACEVSASPMNKCNLALVANPSPSESPVANSVERSIAPVSSGTPTPSALATPTEEVTPTPSSPDKKITPTPSTPADEAAKHAPLPNLSGSYSVSSYFFAFFSVLVISFYYILI